MGYLILIIIVAGLILIGCMKHGFRVGFAREVTAMLALGGGVLVISLLASMLEKLRSGNAGGIAAGIFLLIVLGVVYRVLHLVLNSINLLARLPVIRWLDSALGLVSGFVTGFAVLYALEFLLTRYFLQ